MSRDRDGLTAHHTHTHTLTNISICSQGIWLRTTWPGHDPVPVSLWSQPGMPWMGLSWAQMGLGAGGWEASEAASPATQIGPGKPCLTDQGSNVRPHPALTKMAFISVLNLILFGGAFLVKT